MDILVIGGGGREHAIVKKLKENPGVGTIYALPGNGGMTADEMIGILTVVIGLLIFAAALIIIFGSMTPDWGGGFGSGLDPDDWFWYTNGVHTIHVARTAPPPKGYTRTDPPKNYHTGGGSSRGGGGGRSF